MFLAISWRKVVDVVFVAAVAEVVEVVEVLFVAAVPEVAEVLDVDGVTVLVPFEAAIPQVDAVAPVAPVAAVAEVPEVSHEELMTTDLVHGSRAADIARSLNSGEDMTDYFELVINANRQSILAHKVRIKPGVRASAPAQETLEIEANGQVVGSLEVDV